MSGSFEAIVLGVLGSSAFCELVRYFIGKWKSSNQVTKKFDEINESIEDVKKELESMKRDEIRLQLMVLMSDYPDKKEEIMIVAERYFGILNGDWYLSNIFKSWLENNDMEIPSWLK